MTKYHVSQSENGKTITYGDFNANNPKEAINMACGVAKRIYPQYNHKIPFMVKEYGHKTEKVKYHG